MKYWSSSGALIAALVAQTDAGCFDPPPNCCNVFGNVQCYDVCGLSKLQFGMIAGFCAFDSDDPSVEAAAREMGCPAGRGDFSCDSTGLTRETENDNLDVICDLCQAPVLPATPRPSPRTTPRPTPRPSLRPTPTPVVRPTPQPTAPHCLIASCKPVVSAPPFPIDIHCQISCKTQAKKDEQKVRQAPPPAILPTEPTGASCSCPPSPRPTPRPSPSPTLWPTPDPTLRPTQSPTSTPPPTPSPTELVCPVTSGLQDSFWAAFDEEGSFPFTCTCDAFKGHFTVDADKCESRAVSEDCVMSETTCNREECYECFDDSEVCGVRGVSEWRSVTDNNRLHALVTTFSFTSVGEVPVVDTVYSLVHSFDDVAAPSCFGKKLATRLVDGIDLENDITCASCIVDPVHNCVALDCRNIEGQGRYDECNGIFLPGNNDVMFVAFFGWVRDAYIYEGNDRHIICDHGDLPAYFTEPAGPKPESLDEYELVNATVNCTFNATNSNMANATSNCVQNTISNNLSNSTVASPLSGNYTVSTSRTP